LQTTETSFRLIQELPLVSSSSNPPIVDQARTTGGDESGTPQAIFARLRHQILELSLDPSESIVGKIYQTLCGILPQIAYDEIPDVGFSRINRLLRVSETMHEEQFALACALAKSSLLVTTNSENRFEKSLLPAMAYFGVAIQIAERHLPTKFSSMEENPHFLASQLITNFIQAEIISTKIFENRMSLAINQCDTALFQTILEDIQRLLPYRCLSGDHQMIEALYEQARSALDKIVDKEIEEQFSSLSREVTRCSDTFPPLATTWITKKYWEALHRFRQSFSIPIEQREDYQQQVEIFANFFEATFLKDAFAILGPPPCQYEMVVMGSTAREEICPYSDLEFFLLIEDSRQLPYFLRLTRLLELQVISLGESPDYSKLLFTSLGKEKPIGFHLDKPDLVHEAGSIFICTPEGLPGWLAKKEDKDYAEDNILQYTLHKVRRICSSGTPLMERYWNQLRENLSQRLPEEQQSCLYQNVGQKRAYYLFERRLKDFDKHPPLTQGVLQVKTHFIHPLFLLLTDLSLYFFELDTQPLEKINTIDIIDSLAELFDESSRNLLKSAVYTLSTLRTRLHLTYVKHQDIALLHPDPSNRELVVLSNEEKNRLKQIEQLVLHPLYAYLRASLERAKEKEIPFIVSMKNISLLNLAGEKAITTYNRTRSAKLNQEIEPFPREVEVILEAFLQCPPKDQKIFYERLSTLLTNEPIRQKYITLLEVSDHKELLRCLLHIPNSSGYRQKDRVARRNLQSAIESITTTQAETKYCITGSFFSEPRYLTQTIAEEIINEANGHLKSRYGPEITQNNVCHALSPQGMDLHFKQAPINQEGSPFFPGREQGVSCLMMRLFGHGASFSELVYLSDFDHPEKEGYFVLISQTVKGETLADIEHEQEELATLDHKRLSQLLLSIPLILPGDHRSVNFVREATEDETGQKIRQLVCIDNDLAWIKPMQRKEEKISFGRIRTTLTCNLSAFLFFFFPEVELHPAAIDEFIAIKPGLLLREWFNDLIALNQTYEATFKNYPSTSISHYFEVDIGTGGHIFVQLCALQSLLRDYAGQQKTIKAEELLKKIVSYDKGQITQVGDKLYNKYREAKSVARTPSEQTKYMTGRGEKKSMTVSQSQFMMYQNLPTQGNRELLRPEQSLRELDQILVFYCNANEFTFIQGDNLICKVENGFGKIVTKEGAPDEIVQGILLESMLANTYDKLVLSHCIVLTDDYLIQLMDKSGQQLTYLDLRYCAAITEKSLHYLPKKCPYLERLYLDGSHLLTTFSEKGYFGYFGKQISLLYLQELTINNCPALSSIHLRSYALKKLQLINNIHLTTINLNVPLIPEVNIKNNPQLGDWRTPLESRLASSWSVSGATLHHLYDVDLKELMLSNYHPDMLEVIKRRKTLDYAHIYIPSNPEGVLTLTQFLLTQFSLLRLNIRGNRLGTEQIPRLIDQLSANRTLLKLNIFGGNEVSDLDQINRIRELLKRNWQLKHHPQARLNQEDEQHLQQLEQHIAILEAAAPTDREVTQIIKALNGISSQHAKREELGQRAEALYNRCPSSSSTDFPRETFSSRFGQASTPLITPKNI
jgi:NLR family CARD domain-containing protein 3